MKNLDDAVLKDELDEIMKDIDSIMKKVESADFIKKASREDGEKKKIKKHLD